MAERGGKGEEDQNTGERNTNAVQHKGCAEKTVDGVNTILDLIWISQVLKRDLATKWSLSQLLFKTTSWIELVYIWLASVHQIGSNLNRIEREKHTHSLLLRTLRRILIRPLLRRIRRIIAHTHIQQMQGIPFLDSERFGEAIRSAVLEIVFEVVEFVGELVRDVVGFVGEPVAKTAGLRWRCGRGGGSGSWFGVVGGVAEGGGV